MLYFKPQEDVMPIDCTVSPPDHLEGGSTEVLTNITSRNVSPLHHGDGNSEHQVSSWLPAETVIAKFRSQHV